MGKNLKKLFLLGLLLTIFAGQKYYAQVASLSEPPLISRSSNPASHVDHIDPVPHDVTVLNLHVHYVESGSGPTVVLIHGNAGGVEDFELGAIDLLSSRFRVIAIDRAGHGGSDRPGTEDASVEFQAKLLHETMSTIGVDKPILVGHSWGAAVALSYSLTYPDSIKGLVLLAPAAYPDGKSYKLLRAAARVPVFHEQTEITESCQHVRKLLVSYD